MNNKALLALEITWIVTGLAATALGTRYVINGGGGRTTLLFALIAVISFLFAWIRHRQRKNG